MIEVTIGNVVDALPVLERLAQEKLPVRAAWRISRLILRLRPVLPAFEQARLAIFQKLGAPTVDGKGYTVPAPRTTELKAELEELLARTVEVEQEQIPVSFFDGAMVSPSDFLALGPFLVEQAGRVDLSERLSHG